MPTDYALVQFPPPHDNPEWYVLGKPHPDRAKQFMAFDALKGFRELIAKAENQSEDSGCSNHHCKNNSHD